MSASEIKLTESDEVTRKPVVPVTEPPQDDTDQDRSPIDEETKRDAPVEPLPDDKDDTEKVRQPILPDES